MLREHLKKKIDAYYNVVIDLREDHLDSRILNEEIKYWHTHDHYAGSSQGYHSSFPGKKALVIPDNYYMFVIATEIDRLIGIPEGYVISADKLVKALVYDNELAKAFKTLYNSMLMGRVEMVLNSCLLVNMKHLRKWVRRRGRFLLQKHFSGESSRIPFPAPSETRYAPQIKIGRDAKVDFNAMQQEAIENNERRALED